MGVVVPDKFAVMAVDPGGVSGVARGVFEPGRVRGGHGSGLGELFAFAVLEGLECWEVRGAVELQAWEIAAQWLEWVAELNIGGLGLDCMWLVFEQFALRQRNVELSPVEVTAGVRCLLVPRAIGLGESEAVLRDGGIEYQSAADCKRFATSTRLAGWGLYGLGRGSDHKRDALRHLALKAARVFQGI